MTEMGKIAGLLRQTFEGSPYHGPSMLSTLEGIPASVAIRKPQWSVHCMWQLVVHVTAELEYALQVLKGSAGPWVEGKTTWPAITDTSEPSWKAAVARLKKANRDLVRAVRKLDDATLAKMPSRVRGPYYRMLHGTIHHNVHHTGQLSLLRGQLEGQRSGNL